MQSAKFYGAVFGIGMLADFGTNMATKNSTSGMTGGLASFYKTASPVKTALLAGATFLAVVFVADLIVSKKRRK